MPVKAFVTFEESKSLENSAALSKTNSIFSLFPTRSKQEVKGENTSFFGKKIEKFKQKFKKKKKEKGEPGNLETANKNYPSNGSLQNNQQQRLTSTSGDPSLTDPDKKGGKTNEMIYF